MFDFGTRMGLVLGGLIIPWLLVGLGWRATFRLLGFAGLLWVIPWLWATKGQLGRPPRRAAGTRNRAQQIRWLLTNRNLIGICLGFFCFDYYWYLFVTWLPDYLVTVRHFTILRAGFFSALPYFVFGASEPLGGWIADRLTAYGWNETRTRKGIVTVAFLCGLFSFPRRECRAPMPPLRSLPAVRWLDWRPGICWSSCSAALPMRMLGCGPVWGTSPGTWAGCWLR